MKKQYSLNSKRENEYHKKLAQETLIRWKEVEDGKVVSHQAVSKWLDTWGEDIESDRPVSKR